MSQNVVQGAAQSAPNGASAPPGWYEDWTGTGTRRWWDGTHWTAYVYTVPPQLGGAPAPSKPHRRLALQLLQTHAKSAVLFLLTLITAFIGFHMLPPNNPSHATSNIQEVDISLPPASKSVGAQDAGNEQTATIDMKGDGHGGTKLRVWAADLDVDAFRVRLPADTWSKDSKDCGRNQPKGVSCSVSDGTKVLVFNYPTMAWVDIPKSDGEGWGVINNSEFVSVLIPTVGVYTDVSDTSSVDKQAVVFVQYHTTITDSYTWASGNEPQDLTSGVPAWPVQSLNSWNPITENGTAIDREYKNSLSIFLAGAVVGVAAAAFAAGIAEMVGTSASEGKKRRNDAEAASMASR